MPLLTEDGVYSISHVKVVPGPALYRSVDRDLAINFYYKTKIQKISDTEQIARYKFELKSFWDIPNYVGEVKCFIDIIGLVTNYGQMETRSNGAKKMDVVLTNARDDKLVVSLWEGKATKFLDLLASAGDVPAFVVITGLMAKKFSDKVILSSSDATKTYLNIDYAPLNDLRASVLQTTGCIPENLPRPTAKRFAAADHNNLKDSTIKDILETSLPNGATVTRRTCEATIVAVLEAEGWYYNCCPRCSRKVQAINGNCYCNHCAREADDFKPRFRLIVRVEDNSGRTSFTLFNKEAEERIGVPVEKILNELPEETDLTVVPPIVKNIVGKRCAFDIKINAYNTERGYEEYTVFRLLQCPGGNQEGGEENTKGDSAKRLKTA